MSKWQELQQVVDGMIYIHFHVYEAKTKQEHHLYTDGEENYYHVIKSLKWGKYRPVSVSKIEATSYQRMLQKIEYENMDAGYCSKAFLINNRSLSEKEFNELVSKIKAKITEEKDKGELK